MFSLRITPKIIFTCPIRKKKGIIQLWTALAGVHVMFVQYAMKTTLYKHDHITANVKAECFIQYMGGLKLKS
jgi:hypothetical protein